MLFLPLLFVTVRSLTCSQQTAIQKDFVNILENNARTVDEVPGDTAADWLRLCFHDGVTWDPQSRTGGCHACLFVDCNDGLCERHLEANAGLEQIMENLESSYSKWNRYLSRPDYWFMSCKVAIEWASKNEIYIPYSWGRTNCNVAKPYWPDRHPDADDGFEALQDTFFDRLQFSTEETYSLLGAHSIGRAQLAHQGYEGRWVQAPENYFSNSFFQVLLSHQWFHATMPPMADGTQEHQYTTSDFQDSIMLFTDVSMGWTLDGNDYGCNITRNSQSCVKRSQLSVVRNFAQNNNYFLDTFAGAWGKLNQFGGDRLRQNPSSCDYSYTRACLYGSGS